MMTGALVRLRRPRLRPIRLFLGEGVVGLEKVHVAAWLSRPWFLEPDCIRIELGTGKTTTLRYI